jgi:hypothetical protein
MILVTISNNRALKVHIVLKKVQNKSSPAQKTGLFLSADATLPAMLFV